MEINTGDIIEVWTGAAIGSPYPPQVGDSWAKAEVVENKGGRFQISWQSNRPGLLWVPPAAVRGVRKKPRPVETDRGSSC